MQLQRAPTIQCTVQMCMLHNYIPPKTQNTPSYHRRSSPSSPPPGMIYEHFDTTFLASTPSPPPEEVTLLTASPRGWWCLGSASKYSYVGFGNAGFSTRGTTAPSCFFWPVLFRSTDVRSSGVTETAFHIAGGGEPRVARDTSSPASRCSSAAFTDRKSVV